MSSAPYELERGGRAKITCPECGKPRVFTRYIEKSTGNYLSDDVGRCDRLDNCGYHKPPREFFKENGKKIQPTSTKQHQPLPDLPTSFVPKEMLVKSQDKNLDSNFAQSLIERYSKEQVREIVNRYQLGRSKEHDGRAVIFWQVDKDQNVRTGKIMFYDAKTGKRLKGEWAKPRWVHKSKKLTQPFVFKQCFFGEHLLKDSKKIVAVVEAEKTAIHAAIQMPQYDWIATGGVSGIRWQETDVIEVLRNRSVLLFPDFGFYNRRENISCYERWCNVAKEIQSKVDCTVHVSRVLEDNLNEELRSNGLDIADFLMQTNLYQSSKLTNNECL